MTPSCWDRLGRSPRLSIVARWFPPDSMLARVSAKNLTRAMFTLKSPLWNETRWPGRTPPPTHHGSHPKCGSQACFRSPLPPGPCVSHQLLLLTQIREGSCQDHQGLAWKGHVSSLMLHLDMCGTTLLTPLEHAETCSAIARRPPSLTALGLGIPRKASNSARNVKQGTAYIHIYVYIYIHIHTFPKHLFTYYLIFKTIL